MSTERKGILDTLFDAADKVVGGMEKSKELSDPLPEDDDDEMWHPDKSLSRVGRAGVLKTQSQAGKVDIIWITNAEGETHISVITSPYNPICSRSFESFEITSRKFEMPLSCL